MYKNARFNLPHWLQVLLQKLLILVFFWFPNAVLHFFALLDDPKELPSFWEHLLLRFEQDLLSFLQLVLLVILLGNASLQEPISKIKCKIKCYVITFLLNRWKVHQFLIDFTHLLNHVLALKPIYKNLEYLSSGHQFCQA